MIGVTRYYDPWALISKRNLLDQNIYGPKAHKCGLRPNMILQLTRDKKWASIYLALDRMSHLKIDLELLISYYDEMDLMKYRIFKR